MSGRREHGEGSVYQRRDGMWIASVTLPPSPDGKRRRKVKASKSEAKAWEHLRAMRRELLREGDIITGTPTLTAWCDTYFKRAERDGSLRPRTLHSHRGVLARYALPIIGKTRLDQLTPEHIRRVHALIQDELGLSPTTALQAHNILSGVLKAAVLDGIIRDNPAARTRRPKAAHFDAKTLTVKEAVQLLAWSAGDPWHSTRWSLALWAGLRQSEALGLRAEDVDMDRNVLRIRWQLQRILEGTPHESLGAIHLSGQYWLVPPKSKRGVREVPMSRPLRTVLAARLEDMRESGEEFVVAAPRGGYLDHSKDLKRWRKALDGAGLPQVRLHDARHTTGTLLRAAGVEPRVIQVILGHNTAAMTEHYSHLGEHEAEQAVAAFAALMGEATRQIEH